MVLPSRLLLVVAILAAGGAWMAQSGVP
ncbi:MAG: hypothetical protein RLZZ217_1876, partial [Planctomycetota bacterium]